ncbi:hypothetical protein D1BOALGB6SA_3505 [Olavius sp. associated proteobacterium Delta 1]|nr:hypothetical protein D1BOALGB6SA_3505 [Olavius sp. associated proteobacterium Delta 1]
MPTLWALFLIKEGNYYLSLEFAKPKRWPREKMSRFGLR